MVKSVSHLVSHLCEPPPIGKVATHTTPRPCPPEAENVNHFAAVGSRAFLLLLDDILHDDIEAAMVFDGGFQVGANRFVELPSGIIS